MGFNSEFKGLSFHLRLYLCFQTDLRHYAFRNNQTNKQTNKKLTPCSGVLEKQTGSQLVKKFPSFHRPRRFITAFTRARYLSLCPCSHPTYWRSILILTYHQRPGLPNGLFPSCFPTKTLFTPLLSPIRATCPAPLILLDLITHTILGEHYRSLSSSLCSFSHFPVT